MEIEYCNNPQKLDEMEASRTIHLAKPNTLAELFPEDERRSVVSLKITGFLGRKDFDDVLDEMCTVWGDYDDDDNWSSDYGEAYPLKQLDLGEATYVDGVDLPYFGFHTQLETFIMPQGIDRMLDGDENESGLSNTPKLRNLVLSDGVRTVGGCQNCPNLSGLILPESVEELESFAFCGCKSINKIKIPQSVRCLDGSCFADCGISGYGVAPENPNFTVVDGVVYSKDLKTLVAYPSALPRKHFVIPSTTKFIGWGAFMDSKIESIEFPEGLLSIGGWSFQGSSLKKVEIPDTVAVIGESAFQFCKDLQEVRLSNGLESLPQQLFSSCSSLKVLDIPSSVKVVDYSCFIWSENLERIILHDGLEVIDTIPWPLIGEGKLKEVRLPKTLRQVPGGAFNYSPYIKEFHIDPDNPFYSVIDGSLYSKDGKTLVSVPDYHRKEFIVPEGVEVLEKGALYGYPYLNSIHLPSTLREVGERALASNPALKTIRIPQNVSKVHVDALWNDNLKTVTIDCETPPEMTGSIMENDWRYKRVVLLVPTQSLSVYRQAKGWNAFSIKAQ